MKNETVHYHCPRGRHHAPHRYSRARHRRMAITTLALAVLLAGCSGTIAGGAQAGPPDAGERYRSGLVDELTLTADLDQDGRPETLKLGWESHGGSGTYDYLVTLDDRGTEISRAALGDRVQVMKASAAPGRVVLDTVEAGPGDAACCPGQKKRRRFTLQDGQLVEVETAVTGRLDIGDLAGNWQLQADDGSTPLPTSVAVTLAFDGARIAGSSGCNRYMGLVVPGDTPGELRMKGPLAGTMMACPPPLDSIERDFLSKLQALQRYSFLAGSLVLSWATEDEQGILKFRRAD